MMLLSPRLVMINQMVQKYDARGTGRPEIRFWHIEISHHLLQRNLSILCDKNNGLAYTWLHPPCRPLSDQWQSKQSDKFRLMPYVDCNITQSGKDSYWAVYQKDNHTSLICPMTIFCDNDTEMCQILGLLSLSQWQLLWTWQRTFRITKGGESTFMRRITTFRSRRTAYTTVVP